MMLSKTGLLVLSLLLGASSLFAAGEKLVAEWNFAKGSPASTDGKFSGKLMGKTTIAGNVKDGFFLFPGKSGKDVQEGLVIASKSPDLAPADGFKLEMVFSIQEATSTQPYLMLFDNKGIPHSPNAPKLEWHHGFCLFLVRRGESTFQPMALIGHGKYSSFIAGNKYVKLDEEVKHTITLSYDGISKLALTLNGKSLGNVTAKKAGKVAPPLHNLTLGDRAGSGPYYRFDGKIYQVKLYSLQ